MRNLRVIGALTCAAALACAGTAAADTTVVVTEQDLATGNGWYPGDTRGAGNATFEHGPATPPSGVGSVQLRTPAGTDKVQLMTDRHAGTRLDAVDAIGYSTFQDPLHSGFVAGLPSLNLRVDLDDDGVAEAYMVYEPYQDHGNAAVANGVWQTWDAYQGGAAEWWVSNKAPGMPAIPECIQATPCTWDEIVALRPDAAIREGADAFRGSLGVNQGSGNGGFHTNADSLYVGTGGETTTYDFEPAITPGSKEDCKKGGWQQFNSPAFKNQGDCVSSFAPGRNK